MKRCCGRPGKESKWFNKRPGRRMGSGSKIEEAGARWKIIVEFLKSTEYFFSSKYERNQGETYNDARHLPSPQYSRGFPLAICCLKVVSLNLRSSNQPQSMAITARISCRYDRRRGKTKIVVNHCGTGRITLFSYLSCSHPLVASEALKRVFNLGPITKFCFTIHQYQAPYKRDCN